MTQLIEKGYHVGKNYELFSDFLTFQYHCSMIQKLEKNENFIYRFEYFGSKTPYPMFIKENQIKERENFVNQNNFDVFQRWWQYEGENFKNTINYFRNIITDFIKKNYDNIEELIHMDNITLFEDGDFISKHKDGFNKDRVCVFLIYLSELKEYNDGGGTLIINDEKEVYPFNENFVVLDFTKNNIYHEVTPVKNGFKRFTYINFISKK